MLTSDVDPPSTGLASHLIHDGLLEPMLAKKVLREAKQHNLSLVTYLVKNNILRSEEIMATCIKNVGLQTFDLTHYNLSWLNDSVLTPEIIRRYRAIPLPKQNDTLQIGISDPTDQHIINSIMFYTGLRILPVIVDEDKLNQLIENEITTERNLELELLEKISIDENSHVLQEKIIHYDEPLIKFVDSLIKNALQQSASDIHIEPYETICRVRYRQDGILHEIADIPIQLAARLVTRLKVMAKLDISERRLPQDGRLQLHSIDIRINTCPTLFGEKIVLRLLDFKKVSLEINALGFTETQANLFLKKISQSQGMVLVTGPTGSGKTVTLYSALNYLNTSEKNISTVEDPIEIQLTGINQVNINPKIGFDFAMALRTFLRQDPNIIMVGEIRDTETAEIAIQAAQTGHLVLSTLHTNSAIETITRLQSMSIAPYNIISSISLIIAQRLVRKLCLHCKQPEIISSDTLKSMGFQPPSQENFTIYRHQGCKHCLQGYLGRVGIYELLPITESIAQLIMSKANILMITEQAQREGFLTLQNRGLENILQGITSLAEINRVIQR